MILLGKLRAIYLVIFLMQVPPRKRRASTDMTKSTVSCFCNVEEAQVTTALDEANV